MDDFPFSFIEMASEIEMPTDLYRGADCREQMQIRNIVVFRRTTRLALQGRNFEDRSHHRHVLLMVLRTAGVISVDGVGYSLVPGTGFLVLPYQFHHYFDLEGEELNWLFITFEVESGVGMLTEMGDRVLRFDPASLEALRAVLGIWKRGRDSRRDAELLAWMNLAIIRMHRQAWRKEGDSPAIPESSSWIAKVEREVRRTVEENRSVEQVAEMFRMSTRYLRSCFFRETGLTIRRYRANYQLNRTLALMRDPQLGLTEIAVSVGFQSQPSFNRFVRRETGMNPSELRKKVRAGTFAIPAR